MANRTTDHGRRGENRGTIAVSLRYRRLAMTKPWQLISLVLIALSLILAIADRAILQPMYLLVLALVVMYGTNTKFPWG